MNRLIILDPDSMKYKEQIIKMKTNVGELQISYEDAFEIMWTLLDATIGISKETERILKQIDNEFMLDKF